MAGGDGRETLSAVNDPARTHPVFHLVCRVPDVVQQILQSFQHPIHGGIGVPVILLDWKVTANPKAMSAAAAVWHMHSPFLSRPMVHLWRRCREVSARA